VIKLLITTSEAQSKLDQLSPMLWHCGKDKPSVNTPATKLLQRKESQLIMEQQCNASADMNKKLNYLKNQKVILSTVISSAVTISLIRMSPKLWV